MQPADLKQARTTLGLSQRDLAKSLGLAHNTVWRWETGRVEIQHPRMLALALWALAESPPARPRPLVDLPF